MPFLAAAAFTSGERERVSRIAYRVSRIAYRVVQSACANG
jgi:hypothetical protein